MLPPSRLLPCSQATALSAPIPIPPLGHRLGPVAHLKFREIPCWSRRDTQARGYIFLEKMLQIRMLAQTRSSPMVAVIIPTLNEEELLPTTLNCIRANDAACELLVVDGGSGDATVQLAETGGARVIHSPKRQRALQMNLGAQQARSDIFLFLHADTWLGPNALRQIEKALDQPAVVGGGFARRFLGASPVLCLTCWIGESRSRLLGWFFGDQGIFARRSAFERVGGFRELPLFEDLDFCRRLSRLGSLTTLRPPIVSSSRRFDARGSLLTTLSDVWLTTRYLCGADPVKLASERRKAGQ